MSSSQRRVCPSALGCEEVQRCRGDNKGCVTVVMILDHDREEAIAQFIQNLSPAIKYNVPTVKYDKTRLKFKEESRSSQRLGLQGTRSSDLLRPPVHIKGINVLNHPGPVDVIQNLEIRKGDWRLSFV